MEQGEQPLIPGILVDVIEHGARGVRHVGDVQRAAGELPREPAVHGAECEFAALGMQPQARDAVEQPGELGGREIRVEHQTGLVAHRRCPAAPLQPRTRGGGAPVLPDDRVMHRLAGLALPHDGGLALVGDAERRNIGRFQSGLGERAPGDPQLRAPDVLRVMLNPARVREDLAEFLLRRGAYAAVLGEDYRAGAGGALIEGQDVFHVVVDRA
jgi:hypothetical protein